MIANLIGFTVLGLLVAFAAGGLWFAFSRRRRGVAGVLARLDAPSPETLRQSGVSVSVLQKVGRAVARSSLRCDCVLRADGLYCLREDRKWARA